MIRSLPLLAAALLLAVPAPVEAGTVYVPFAGAITVGGVEYETQVWATNVSSDQQRKIEYYLIPPATSGVERSANPEMLWIQPQHTVRLQVTSETGGVLEIFGPPQIRVSARLVRNGAGQGPLDGTQMPVIDSDNVIPAGGTAYLQGWERSDAGTASSFSLLNLGHQSNRCEVVVQRANGSVIIDVTLLIPGLGHARFEDALGILGEKNITDVTTSVSCDEPFFPYSMIQYPGTERFVFVSPASSVASSLLRPGDEPPSEAPPANDCSAGATYCFEQQGVFYAPTRREQVKWIDVPVPQGHYTRLKASLSFRHGGWNQGRPSAAHNLLWLARDGRHFDLFGYVNVFGPGRDEVLLRHGLGQVHQDKARLTAHAVLQPGRVYHLEYTYDTGQRFIEMIITDAQGEDVVVLRHVPNANSVRVDPGAPYTVAIGFVEGENPNEVPTYGWEYINLVVEFFQ